MKIVIAGAGEMGSHLAKMLSGNGHDITVIDSDPKLLADVASLADVLTVEGDSTTFAVLRKASVRKCDLFIAVNHVENDNVVAAVLAKQLGAKKSIARIDNNEYLEPNNKEIFINMGIDYLFYPEKVAAQEVINLLGHTSTTEYVDFSSGRLSLVVFRLDPTSSLIGRELSGFKDDAAQLSYRTVAIARGGQTIIARQDEIFMEGDMVYVIARQDAVKEVMEFSGHSNVEINNMMILGDKSGLTLPELKLYGTLGENQTDFSPRLVGVGEYDDRPFAGHYYLIRHVIGVLNGTESLMITPQQVINTAATLEMFYRSSELGREVRRSEIL